MSELEEKVIRLYKDKGYSLRMFANLGICDAKKASAIINKHHVMRDSVKLLKDRVNGKIDY